MDARRTKQLIYGAIYLAVLIVVITGIYFWFLKPAPSCFDHKQDGGETGVDCGGPCAAICTTGAVPIALVPGTDVSSFLSNPGHYTFLAEVLNTNPGFAAQSFDYDFS